VGVTKNEEIYFFLCVIQFMPIFGHVLKKIPCLQVHLYGGLNNLKMELLAACRIAADKKLVLIEPQFPPVANIGTSNVLFSDVYDFEYFAQTMKEYFCMIPYDHYYGFPIYMEWDYLWNQVVHEEQEKNKLKYHHCDDFETAFYLALKLNENNQKIVDAVKNTVHDSYVAIHLRIEDDWPKDNSQKMLFVDSEEILEKFNNSDLKNAKKIYFATAYKGTEKIAPWTNKGYQIYRHPDNLNSLNYHILSAIDFQICVDADYFVGNTESSFSNLVTRTRQIMKKGNNFYYNCAGKSILLREDGGMHPC
jgi:hypothetical protein